MVTLAKRTTLTPLLSTVAVYVMVVGLKTCVDIVNRGLLAAILIQKQRADIRIAMQTASFQVSGGMLKLKYTLDYRL